MLSPTRLVEADSLRWKLEFTFRGPIWPQGDSEVSSANETLASKIQISFRQLSDAANSLNKLSDDFGKLASDLDSSMQRLNPGVSAWVTFYNVSTDLVAMETTTQQIGYARIEGKWSLAIRSYMENLGKEGWYGMKEWRFNDAPRDMRMRSIEQLPNLCELLANEASKAAMEVEGKVAILQSLTNPIAEVSGESEKVRSQKAGNR